MMLPVSASQSNPLLPRRGFWSRGWMWMIPLGLVILALVCGVLITFSLKSSARRIRESEPYQHAVARALANAGVVKVLGAPVVVGKVAIGDVKVRNDGSGDADFHFNLVGQWRSALVHVTAKRSGGKWNYSEMSFLPNGGGDGIDLTYEAPAPATAPVQPNP
jgi:hypothetical protein